MRYSSDAQFCQLGGFSELRARVPIRVMHSTHDVKLEPFQLLEAVTSVGNTTKFTRARLINADGQVARF